MGLKLGFNAGGVGGRHQRHTGVVVEVKDEFFKSSTYKYLKIEKHFSSKDMDWSVWKIIV